MTTVNEEAKEQTIEQVQQEYKSKKKMIEGEFKRDAGRLAQKIENDEKKIKSETKKLEQIQDQKFEELESDFDEVMTDLKELKLMKIISEQTYHDWSLKYGHIFEAGIGADAIKEMLERINVEETMIMLQEELKGATKTKRDRLIRRLKLIKSLYINEIKPE